MPFIPFTLSRCPPPNLTLMENQFTPPLCKIRTALSVFLNAGEIKGTPLRAANSARPSSGHFTRMQAQCRLLPHLDPATKIQPRLKGQEVKLQSFRLKSENSKSDEICCSRRGRAQRQAEDA